MDDVGSWAKFDQAMGAGVSVCAEEVAGPLAFYGRCSTEDHQDAETSRGWQLGNARRFVEPWGGGVEADFFDVGQ